MKITDVPKNSKAAKNLRRLPPGARRERLRCAGWALFHAKLYQRLYPENPAQWIRCEAILRDILKDFSLTLAQFK